MSDNISTKPSRVHYRAGTMRKLTGLFLVALLLPAVPASAASVVPHKAAPVSRLADAGVKRENGHSPLRIDIQMVPRQIVGLGYAGDSPTGDSPTGESRWAAGATSDWHAGMNRAVDRLVGPPKNVDVYAVQTEDRLSSDLEGPHGPTKTLAGFEVVFH